MATILKMESRSYGGKKFRPSTQVFHERESGLLICVTNWGKTQVGDQVTESIRNFISMAKEDEDLTVAYVRKDHLHQLGNVLRMATIMASEKIFNQYNKDEYTCGFEIFAAAHEGPQWTFVSCGQPSLLLSREGQGLIPIFHSLDLNVLTHDSSARDPLPNHLLGLGQHPPIHYGNLTLRSHDRLALLSRPFLPSSLFKLTHQDFNLQNISDTLARDDGDLPFWLNFIQVE